MRNAVTNKIRLLKNIEPNPDWLKSQRSNLLLEISESGKKAKPAFRMPVFVLPQFAFKPVLVSLVLFCLIFGGGFLTVSAAKNSLPGDLLYPIKIIMEDVRVKISSQETKSKLEAEFVGRRARELSRIIEESGDLMDKKERVVMILGKLQAQIVSTKVHLDKIKDDSELEKVVEAAEAVSEKAAQAEEVLIEAKEKIAKEEDSKEVIEAIEEALTVIIAANKERERWIQMEVKEIKELPIEEVNN